MKNRCFVAGISIAIISFMLGQVAAEDEAGGQQAPAWMQPVQQHADLKKSVGEWTVAGEMSMAPGAPMQPFTAAATRTSILGGKYVYEVFKGNFGGMPFEGNLIQGYDTVRKKHVSIWLDSSSPVPSIAHGMMKDGVVVMEGEDPDWMSGKLKKTKQVVKFDNDDQTTVSFYDVGTGEGGKDRLTMTLIYKRKTEK